MSFDANKIPQLQHNSVYFRFCLFLSVFFLFEIYILFILSTNLVDSRPDKDGVYNVGVNYVYPVNKPGSP